MLKIPRIRESIFLKILFVFVLAAVANIVVVHVFVRNFLVDENRRAHRVQNLAEYGKLLVASQPTPPTEDSVSELGRRLHLLIRVEGTGVDIATSPNLPSAAEIRRVVNARFEDSTSRAGRWSDYLVLQIQGSGGLTWDLFLAGDNKLDTHPWLLLVPLSALLLILTACYFMVRRILSPLTVIEQGVQNVAQGRLESDLPTRGRDELARLTDSFNRMTEQVRTMIVAKEQLLLDVSHEFRSPLTRIKVAMELPAEEGRESILNSLRELETMLTELLESARLNAPKGGLRRVPTDLAAMVREFVEEHEDQRPGLNILVAPPALVVEVDPARMQIVLRNLLENSMKYSAHQDRPVEISLRRRPEGGALLAVRDHGVGIAPEEQRLIFEPFYRVDRSRLKSTGGYGLGLSLVRKIVEAHDGVIRVTSRLQEGALFEVELPMLSDAGVDRKIDV